MANIKSFPNNQDDFIGAEEVMKWLHGRTSGVFAAGGQCAVAAVADSMSVTVSDGNGWMSNADGDGIVWWISNEKDTGTKLTLTGDMADATLPRIDRIVVSWPTTNYVGLPAVEFRKGTPASNPVPPALTNNNIMRQISLAQIRIPAGATTITNSMITDERLDPTVCGIVTESIQVDTSVIHAQLLEAYLEYTRNMDKYTADSRAAFESWFEAVKDALSGDVAGNLQNQINELRDAAEAYKVENKTYVDTLGLVTAAHSKTGTTHTLTAPPGCGNLKFVAAAPFADGDTITLNGVEVVPKTQDGEALTGGAWAAGAVVMCLVSPDGGTLFFKGGGGNGKSEIIVTAPSGCTVTATCGSIVKRASAKNAKFVLRGLDLGTWTITAELAEHEPLTLVMSISRHGTKYVTFDFIARTAYVDRSAIIAKIDAGSTVTLTKGDTIYTAVAVAGEAVFEDVELGEWMIAYSSQDHPEPITKAVSLERVEIIYLELTYYAPDEYLFLYGKQRYKWRGRAWPYGGGTQAVEPTVSTNDDGSVSISYSKSGSSLMGTAYELAEDVDLTDVATIKALVNYSNTSGSKSANMYLVANERDDTGWGQENAASYAYINHGSEDQTIAIDVSKLSGRYDIAICMYANTGCPASTFTTVLKEMKME